MRIIVVTSSRASEVTDPIKYLDVKTTIVQVDPTESFIRRNIRLLLETRQSIRRHKPDAILLDSLEMTGFLVMLLSMWYRIPYICRLVGEQWRVLKELYRPDRGHGQLRRLRYHLSLYLNECIYANASGFITVSEELGEAIRQRTNHSRDQIETVPVPLTNDWNGGSANTARHQFNITESKIILTVTNLSFHKKYEGVQEIIDDLCDVLREYEDTAYIVAGDGTYYEDLLRYINDTVTDPELRRRIYVPGFVENVDDLYALADVFLYVSYIDGYPNVVNEAQAAGLPVIANAAHGMVEQIDHDRTGFLLDRSEPGILQRQMCFLLDHPDERTHMGREARRTVLRRNSPEAIGRRLQTAITRLLS